MLKGYPGGSSQSKLENSKTKTYEWDGNRLTQAIFSLRTRFPSISFAKAIDTHKVLPTCHDHNIGT